MSSVWIRGFIMVPYPTEKDGRLFFIKLFYPQDILVTFKQSDDMKM